MNAKHYTNECVKDIPSSCLNDKDVLVFDDSIHTGKSVTDILSGIPGSSRVRVACVMINDEALEALKKKDIAVEYLEKFKEYTSYDGNKELSQGCQAYYYVYFMIPYISTLSINYSPDYKSLSLMIRGGSSKDLKKMTDPIIGAVNGVDEDDVYVVDDTLYTRRISFSIDGKYLDDFLNDLDVPHEIDQSKIRVSASVYKDYSEIVITPMLCPICVDTEGVDAEKLPLMISERFIRDHCEKISEILTENGFEITWRRIVKGTADHNGIGRQ